MEDERAELQVNIASLEKWCEETRETLETQIENDQGRLSNAQTKLAQATEKEADAGEIARETAKQHEQLEEGLQKQMKTCSGNYINFETELCALKKIRGELYKIKGGGHSAFFQDCEVSKWDPEECNKKCALEGIGGEQKLTRNVLTPRKGGAKCLPLEAMRSCNNHPCPVDCKTSPWSEWSKCSAECGGGVRQRLKDVKRAMKYGGKTCGATSQGSSCNIESCEADCELSPWTAWSTCSKDCDGGTQKRDRFVHVPAAGEGKCPSKWSKDRLQYKQCNLHRCEVVDAAKPMLCNRTMDIVLLLDGSTSLGKTGWEAEIQAAENLVDAFIDSGKANMAVILYSGPSTWPGVRKCARNRNVDPEKFCKIKTVTHFTENLKKVKQLIAGLVWPKGSTLTSMALMAAKTEMQFGRKGKPSTVIAITDGRPLSLRRTYFASRAVRRGSRLLWVPVTKYISLKYIKRWATRRWKENVVVVRGFGDLVLPEVVTHIVADICPLEDPKSEFLLQF